MPLPRSSSLTHNAPPAQTCFCGRRLDIHTDDSSIYCSAACARLDSMSALCAQENIGGAGTSRVKQVFRLGMKEALAKSSHYRRIEREGNRRLAGKGIEAVRAEKIKQKASPTHPVQGAAKATLAPAPVTKLRPLLLSPSLPAMALARDMGKLELQQGYTTQQASTTSAGTRDKRPDLPRSNAHQGRSAHAPPLHSYFSTSTMSISTIRSEALSEAGLGMHITPSSSSGWLTSSESLSSLSSSGSIRSEDAGIEKNTSSPKFHDLFTPLVLQTPMFGSHSHLFSTPEDVQSGLKVENGRGALSASKSPMLEFRPESAWRPGEDSALGDFLYDF